ncbi:MAG TPA: ArsI/CadI family heavy metal resistance metalloenzyme [Candidatus Dormibacteraeota bacterium]
MSRVQLAINVSDVDAAVAFYSKLFGAAPAKRRPGYANFAITEPPLKLVLIQGDGAPGGLNHLGVEVEDTAKVQDAISRFGEQDLAVDVEDGVTCCYAVQDKVWVTDPDGAKWEFYTVLADAESMHPVATSDMAACCATAGSDAAEPAVVDASACC